MNKNKIISIQSKLIYGYVGSNVAELAIQLHGIDTISFPTVLLATHTGHKPVYGKAIEKDRFDELVRGIEALGIIADASCLITGYIGSEDILDSTAVFAKKIKEAYPQIIYVCDPVMGDVDKGMYVPSGVASKLIDKLIPTCDVMTPNHYELEHILGQSVKSAEAINKQVGKHALLSQKTLVVTSCELEDTPENTIETLIVRQNRIKRIQSKRVNLSTTGTGDLFTAMLAARLTLGKDIEDAVSDAMRVISNCLNYILDNNLEEMNARCLVKYIQQDK